MPELPEVETVCRELSALLIGKVCSEIQFHRDTLRFPLPKPLLKHIFVGQEIKKIFRRSKYILIETSTGHGIFHLGMSGKILSMESSTPVFPHTHLVFSFLMGEAKPVKKSKKMEEGALKKDFLHFVDPRRFGMVHGCENGAWRDHPYLANLGVEPLQEKNLGKYFWEKSRRKNQKLKSFLMDAKVVVGVGNIYACEVLFRCKLHPNLPVSKLTQPHCSHLASELKLLLGEAIEKGGSSFKDYKNLQNDPGAFVHELRVYGREGESCKVCSTKIIRISQGGRGTWLCPTCQP